MLCLTITSTVLFRYLGLALVYVWRGLVQTDVVYAECCEVIAVSVRVKISKPQYAFARFL